MDRHPQSPELLRTGLNAHRRPQSPLRPPNYLFQDVPKAQKDLHGSVIQEVRDRDHFKECMAEMVLLCNEAIRRTEATRSASKPLSLEYIADRLDVDDPCFGYMARSKQGMLQGFISVTTFTNWQKNFRWDSRNECSFSYDHEDDDTNEDTNDENPIGNTNRRMDRDGSLSQALENTVRLGDPHSEGIVWPRIAEVTLLGALGCGKQLVKLIMEQLEFQKPNANANYDYLVLQATDNSIPFYESLGFVRVGAVTYEDEPIKENKRPPRSESPVSTTSDESEAVAAEPLAPSTPDKNDCLARPSNIVSSPLSIHVVKQGGWTPFDVARKYRLDPWDVVFLNKDIFPELSIKTKLKKGTTLYIPKTQEAESIQQETPTKWFVAKENDTPRKIAKIHGVACNKLVQANVNRLAELQPSSRLKAGTRVKVTNLDQMDEVCKQYCHWSFPDDSSVDNGEPSYMMVYKIERKTARAPRVVRDALASKVSLYAPPTLLLEAPKPKLISIPRKLPNPPTPPPKPPSGSDVFKDHQRQLYPEFRAKTIANNQILMKKWINLNKYKQGRYEHVAADCAKHFMSAKEEYQVAHSLWEEECAEMPQPMPVVDKETSLFSKVVKLRDDAIEGTNYTYWFVLTYIPDLMWCHLAPMVPDGVFGPERKKSQGRTKWRLVHESFGHELDISSMFCIPLRSKALKRTADADKEEWDILDGCDLPPRTPDSIDLGSCDVSVETGGQREKRQIRKQPIRPRSAVKPMGGKIAIVKQPAKEVIASPARSTRSSTPLKSTRSSTPLKSRSPSTPLRSRSPKRALVYSPNRMTRSTPPHRASPRLSPMKRKASEDLDPARKARKINNVGARRSVLQS